MGLGPVFEALHARSWVLPRALALINEQVECRKKKKTFFDLFSPRGSEIAPRRMPPLQDSELKRRSGRGAASQKQAWTLELDEHGEPLHCTNEGDFSAIGCVLNPPSHMAHIPNSLH